MFKSLKKYLFYFNGNVTITSFDAHYMYHMYKYVHIYIIVSHVLLFLGLMCPRIRVVPLSRVYFHAS